METFSTDSGNSIVFLDTRKDSELNAILGIIRTSFVIVILVGGALFFTKDTNEFIVSPIESMLAKVRRLSENPLEAAHIEEDMALAEEYIKR